MVKPACNEQSCESTSSYDLIIRRGRVIDPETGRDEIATVTIKGGTIQRILRGQDDSPDDVDRVIDAAGKVVCPGFINTHTHEALAMTAEENVKPVSNLLVFDGITFWLGGNCGMSPTGFRVDLGGGSVMQAGDAERPMSEFFDELSQIPLYNNYATLSGNMTLRSRMGLKHRQKEDGGHIARMKEILDGELEAGSFGVSYGVMYDMGATKKAMIELAEVSREHGGMAAIHTRYPTFNLKHLLGGLNLVIFKRSIHEAIEICQTSGVPLIVSHITDMGQADSTKWAANTIDRAVNEGLPLAGDIIGHDFLINDFFVLTGKGKLPLPFMMKLGNYSIDQFYAGKDLYLDGRLYVKKFGQFSMKQAEFLRKNLKRVTGFSSGVGELPLLCRIIPPADTIRALKYPWTFIGNDVIGPALDPATGEPAPEFPRGLATFSRLLGHWSREKRALSLKEALFKATIAPALWLGLDRKGRLQEGCDADIVIFDPDTIVDRAGWVDGTTNQKPDGISHVIVNGQVVVENNQLTGVTPGRLVRRTWKIPGNTADVLSLWKRNYCA